MLRGVSWFEFFVVLGIVTYLLWKHRPWDPWDPWKQKSLPTNSAPACLSRGGMRFLVSHNRYETDPLAGSQIVDLSPPEFSIMGSQVLCVSKSTRFCSVKAR